MAVFWLTLEGWVVKVNCVGVEQVVANIPTNLMSSTRNCGIVLVCLNLILKFAVAGIEPLGVINNQLAVPEPVGLE
jgi:hypothetical protein